MGLFKFRRFQLLILVGASALLLHGQQQHTLRYAPGKTISLTLPESLEINIAATGLRRVRFFAKSPDGRIFVTGMYSLADNTRGSIFILGGWNENAHTF